MWCAWFFGFAPYQIDEGIDSLYKMSTEWVGYKTGFSEWFYSYVELYSSIPLPDDLVMSQQDIDATLKAIEMLQSSSSDITSSSEEVIEVLKVAPGIDMNAPPLFKVQDIINDLEMLGYDYQLVTDADINNLVILRQAMGEEAYRNLIDSRLGK